MHFFSAVNLPPPQHCITLTQTGPARQSTEVQPNVTHNVQHVLIIRLTVQLWRAPRLQHLIHCKCSQLFLQLEQATLVYLQDFFIKTPCKFTYLSVTMAREMCFQNSWIWISHICGSSLFWKFRYLFPQRKQFKLSWQKKNYFPLCIWWDSILEIWFLFT